ncbi:unnamed protein product, partial [Allacma fusca]
CHGDSQADNSSNSSFPLPFAPINEKFRFQILTREWIALLLCCVLRSMFGTTGGMDSLNEKLVNTDSKEVFGSGIQPDARLLTVISDDKLRSDLEVATGFGRISKERKKRPVNSYFVPFENLGIEVSPLESITRHMFYIGLEVNPNKKMPSLRPVTTSGESSLQEVNSQTQPVKAIEANFVSMNFTRERFEETENNVQARVQRLHNMFPQPLYLTGSNKSLTGKEEFVFTRFHGTLNLEHFKKSSVTVTSQSDDCHQKVSRELFYRSKSFGPSQMFRVEILSVDTFDMLELRITEPKVQEDFKSLMTLMKAYYDTTLINPKKERIPANRIQVGMIAVALVNPFTSDAKFIRVRVGPSQDIKYNERTYSIFTVFGVDEGESYSVPTENLYYIDPDFMQLPFIVNKYQLKDFDFFQGTQIIFSTFESLVNIKRNFKAKISTRSDKESMLCVELFLGKGEYEQHVNYLYLQELLRVLTPTISSDICEVEVCHCNSKGALNQELFVARSLTDGMLYRARVERILFEANQLVVEFVDWGNLETIDATGIFKAAKIDRNYAVIPPQALKARLEHIKEIPDVDVFFKAVAAVPLQVWAPEKDEGTVMKVKRVACFVRKQDRWVPIREYLKRFNILVI